MAREHEAAREFDADLARGRPDDGLVDLAVRMRAAAIDPADAERAQQTFDRYRDQLLEQAPPRRARTRRWERAGWGKRGAALGFAMVASVGGAVLVSSQEPSEPPQQRVEQDGRSVQHTVPDLRAERDRALAALEADYEAALDKVKARRAEAWRSYEQEIAEPRRDRDEALEEVDAEQAETMADLDAEIRGINRDHAEEMRELEQEHKEADAEDRREIEREMKELRREWDEALAEVEVERRAALAEFDAERAEIRRDYEEAVADARQDLDAELAALDARETKIRAEYRDERSAIVAAYAEKVATVGS